MTTPKCHATRYTFGVLGDHTTVHVELRHQEKGMWAILDSVGWALFRDGQWGSERFPSDRTEDFLQGCRYPLDEALQLARKAHEAKVAEHEEWKKKNGVE
jgi:hypothetical protein